MQELNFESKKSYWFIFSYEKNKIEFEDFNDPIKEYLEENIKSEPTFNSDFINFFNNELYNIQNVGGGLRFEKQFIQKGFESKHFIVQGRYIKEENIFKGFLIDDTQNIVIHQKSIQAEKLRSLGALAGGIAHDFNNQLMVILGSCELLKKYLVDPKLKQYLANIELSAQNSSELINKLLTFGHVEKIPKEAFNIVPCIADTVSILQHTTTKKVTVLYDCFLEEMIVCGNDSLIQNAILNICKNAIESITNDGLLMIKASSNYLHELPEEVINNQVFNEGLYATIQISDNGCGMNNETLTKIFDPFFTTKGYEKGTGLGLSTVLGTIESHGGLVGVKSEVDKGTTFTLYFRIVKGADNDMDKVKKRIIIIDDEYLVRMVLRDILLDLEYEVTCFEGGAKAIDYYKMNKDQVDLVICDMMMPEMSGVEVLEELSKIDDDLRFVFLSGYSNECHKDFKNVKAFLRKPILLNTLGEVVEKALK